MFKEKFIKCEKGHLFKKYINDIKLGEWCEQCDYKIENLRWATASENSRGSAGQSSDPDAVYEIVNQTLWFHGKMGEYEGAKELYNKQKEQAVKQLNFFDMFEKELVDET